MLITRRIFRKLIFEALLLEMSVTDIKTAYPALNDPIYSKYLAMIRNQKYITFLDKMLTQLLGPPDNRAEAEDAEFHYGEIIFMVLMHEKYAGNQIPAEYRDLNKLNLQADRMSRRFGLIELIDNLDFKHMSKNQSAYVELTNKDTSRKREAEAQKREADGIDQELPSETVGEEVAPDLYLVGKVNGWDILRPESVTGAIQIGITTWCTVYSTAWNVYVGAGQTLYYVARPKAPYGHKYEESECRVPPVLNNYFALSVDNNGQAILNGGFGGPSVWPDQHEVSLETAADYMDNPEDLPLIINAIEDHYAAAPIVRAGNETDEDFEDEDEEPPVDRQEMKRLRAMSRTLTVFKENFRGYGSPDQRLNFVIGVLQNPNLSNQVFNHIIEKLVLTVSDSKIRDSLLYTTLGPELFKAFMIENIAFMVEIHKNLPEDLLRVFAQSYYSMPHIREIADNLAMNPQVANKIIETINKTVELLRQTIPMNQIHFKRTWKRKELYDEFAVGLLDISFVDGNGNVNNTRRFYEIFKGWQQRQNFSKMQEFLPIELKIKANSSMVMNVLNMEITSIKPAMIEDVIKRQEFVDQRLISQFVDKVTNLVESDPRIVNYASLHRNSRNDYDAKKEFQDKNNVDHRQMSQIANVADIARKALGFDVPEKSKLMSIFYEDNVRHVIDSSKNHDSSRTDENGYYHTPIWGASGLMNAAPIPVNGFTKYILKKIDPKTNWSSWRVFQSRSLEENKLVFEKYEKEVPQEIRVKLSALTVFQNALNDYASNNSRLKSQSLVPYNVRDATRFSILLKFMDLHGEVYNLLKKEGYYFDGTFTRRRMYFCFTPVIEDYNGDYAIFYDIDNFNKLIDVINMHGRDAYKDIYDHKYDRIDFPQINTARPYRSPLDVVLSTLRDNLIDLGFYEGEIISIERNEKLKKINEGL